MSYGKDKDFIIDENTREEVRRDNQRDLVGVTSEVEDVFGNKFKVQVIVFDPNLGEVEQFERISKKEVSKSGAGMGELVSFIKRMIAYPPLKSEEFVALDKVLGRYPIVAAEILTTVFAPSFRGRLNADQLPERADLLETWEV